MKNNKEKVIFLLFPALVLAVFFVNGLHESYPDEFDNILGGRYILEGRLPYVGFFTHHGPVPYFLASLLEVFSGFSFVRFRIAYSLFLFILSFGSYFYLKKRFPEKTDFYLGYIFFLAIAATYFWGHMLLADSLSGFFLVPVFFLIVLSAMERQPLKSSDLIFISIFLFLSLLSSLSYLYLVVIIYFFSIYYYSKGNFQGFYHQNKIKPFVIFLAPFFLFALYLFLTQSFSSYIEQNFIFNMKYYIYNYPRPEGSGFINPLRFAIIISHDFYLNFTHVLLQLRDFNFDFPFNSTLAVADIGLILVFLFSRNFALAALLLLVLIFSNVRSNPLTSAERDYQSAVYIMISLANLTFLLPWLYQLINEKIEFAKKLIYSFLFIFIGIYAFFCFIFVLQKFIDKVYDKYMGKLPLIYDQPQLAPIINKLIDKNDFMWIGPFEFEELFYSKGRLPSRYHILIPGMGKSPKIQKEIIADFNLNKPKVIMFDKRFFILGASPMEYGQFFLDFLEKNYVTLISYRQGNVRYVSALPVNERLDLETKLYINKENIDEIIQKLLRENLIKEAR